MKLYLAEANANLAIGAVWANHCDSAKRVVLGGLNELKDFIVSWDKDIALTECISFILNHMYNVTEF